MWSWTLDTGHWTLDTIHWTMAVNGRDAAPATQITNNNGHKKGEENKTNSPALHKFQN